MNKIILILLWLNLFGYGENKNATYLHSTDLFDVLGRLAVVYNNGSDDYRETEFFHEYQIALTTLTTLSTDQRLFVYQFLIDKLQVNITKSINVWEIIVQNQDENKLLKKLEANHSGSNARMIEAIKEKTK